jgi:hypothetical protein
MKMKLGILGLGVLLLFSIPLLSQYAPFYVLDGYGGVHAGGGAPAISPATPYFGWNIARDIAHLPVATSDTNYGDGILVLDGYGGVHLGGKLSGVSVAATPYFGFDIAKSLTFRRIDPQAYGAAPGTYIDITYPPSTFYQAIGESMNMVLPDAGYVVVTIGAYFCNPASDYTANGKWIAGQMGIGVNSTTDIDYYSDRSFHLSDVITPSYLYPYENVSLTRIFYFDSGGTQRFYFLVRPYSGTGTIRVINPTITCMYFNKRWDTYSLSSSSAPLPSDLALAPNIGKANNSAIGIGIR